MWIIKTMSVPTKSSAPREETVAGKPTAPIDNNIILFSMAASMPRGNAMVDEVQLAGVRFELTTSAEPVSLCRLATV
jgi:hypothetical protein